MYEGVAIPTGLSRSSLMPMTTVGGGRRFATIPDVLSASGLLFYADMQSAIEVNGSSAVKWYDRRGTGRYLGGPDSTTYPTLTPSVTAPTGLVFDGSSDYMIVSIPDFRSLTDVELLFVVSPAAASAVDVNTLRPWWFGNTGDAVSRYPSSRGTGLIQTTVISGDTISVYLAPTGVFSSAIAVGTNNLTWTAGEKMVLRDNRKTVGCSLRKNGNPITYNLGAPATTNATPESIAYTHDDDVILNAVRVNGVVVPSPAATYRAVAIMTGLTDDKRRLVDAIAAWEAGLQAQLPEDNPYKTLRPRI